MMSTLCPVDAFLPLPDCLGDDYSDLGEGKGRGLRGDARGPTARTLGTQRPFRPDPPAEDLLCVPQGSTDLGSLSCSSLDATDLFLPEFGLEHSVEVRGGAWAVPRAPSCLLS